MPSEASLKQYARVIANLEGRGINFKDHKTAIGIIQTKMNSSPASLATQASVLSAVKHHLADKPSDLAFYTAEHDKVKKEMNAKGKEPEAFEMKDSEDTWDKVLGEFERMGRTANLVMAVYTLFPPRRLDWRLVEVVKSSKDADDTAKNYYIKDTHKLVFNEYKTKGKYGKQIFELRKGSDLEKALSARPEGLLFAHKDGTAYDDKGFSKFVQQKTGYSPNDFRHSFLTHFHKTAPAPMLKVETAEMMGHSLEQQARYAREERKTSPE